MTPAARKPPVFILGVPRSGTTLLRTILDSHSQIACGPETPWLCGHQPRSVMELWRFMREDKHGYAASYGMPPERVTAACRVMVDELMSAYCAAKGKTRWAEKTPDNALFVEFLLELFPEGRYLHLTRDGLDVAHSTSSIEGHRKGISSFHEQHLVMAPGLHPVANNAFCAVLKWKNWSRLIEVSLDGREHLTVGYERLVSEPESTIRQVTDFIGEPFEPAMLDYARFQHDLPSWEWGSADVKARGRIDRARVGRGRREMNATDLAILTPLARSRADHPPQPAAALASAAELSSPPMTRFMEWLNSLAGPLGLQQFTNWSKVWEYPWLWLDRLDRIDWSRSHLVDLGSALSPIPWICALLGARVTLIETRDRYIPIWQTLRDRLRINVKWELVRDERIPLPDVSADAVTTFSVLEHQPDKAAAVAEAVRILRPGGVLALSFDICEPDQGMTFPEWNGRALTLKEFEDLIWLHPAFGQTQRPAWNTADIPAFIAWHRQSAEHHNYAVGAALLRKQHA
jgi:SAM-dependent methyltransferase